MAKQHFYIQALTAAMATSVEISTQCVEGREFTARSHDTTYVKIVIIDSSLAAYNYICVHSCWYNG